MDAAPALQFEGDERSAGQRFGARRHAVQLDVDDVDDVGGGGGVAGRFRRRCRGGSAFCEHKTRNEKEFFEFEPQRRRVWFRWVLPGFSLFLFFFWWVLSGF